MVYNISKLSMSSLINAAESDSETIVGNDDLIENDIPTIDEVPTSSDSKYDWNHVQCSLTLHFEKNPVYRNKQDDWIQIQFYLIRHFEENPIYRNK